MMMNSLKALACRTVAALGLAISLVAAFSPAHALTDEEARKLATGDTDDRAAALAKAVESADEKTFALIKAMMDDGVKVAAGRVLIVQDDKVIDAVSGEYTFGKVYVGTSTSPLQEVTNASDSTGDGVADTLEGYTTLTDDQVNKAQSTIFALKVYSAEDPSVFIRSDDALTAFPSKFALKWDDAAETFTRVSDGAVFEPSSDGFFHVGGDVNAEKIDIGWVEVIGTDNYTKIFADERLRGPLLKIISWTFIFAIGSVVSTFVVGLALALLFNREDMRGKKVYRALMILPYAFPAFLSAYVWKGLFNTENGFINNVILGGANIPWLTEEGPARIAVLLANLWLGFPYMFLISTGALQAIPAELTESATIDGATPWQQMRLIVLPQALKVVIPPLVGIFIAMFKDTSLVVVIGIYDLTQAGKAALVDQAWRGFSAELYVFLAVLYFVFCYSMSKYSQSLEKRLATGYKR